MTKEAKYKKEVQDRKKEFEDKRVELISQLCVEEPKKNKKKN